MNYWIRRNHKKESDAIISYVRSCSPLISIGLNLYARSTHSIQVVVSENYSFTIIRRQRDWFVHHDEWLVGEDGQLFFRASEFQLEEFNSGFFWQQINTMIASYLPKQMQDD